MPLDQLEKFLQKKNVLNPTTDKIATAIDVTTALPTSVITEEKTIATTKSLATITMAGEVGNPTRTSPQLTELVMKNTATKTPMAVTAIPEIEQFDLNRGEEIYKNVCITCHQPGIVGAPKLGDKANWTPRLNQGIATLFAHSLYGFKGNTGVMPPKGGQLQAPNEDIKAAVAYMISQVQ